MKKNFTLIFLLLLCFFYIEGNAQTPFWSDTFEDTGAPSTGSRTPTYDQGGGGPPFTYYFLRTDGSNIALQPSQLPETYESYQSKQGIKFWAGEDTDRVGTGVNNAADKILNITWSGINITGKSGLKFRGLFAANSGHDWQDITAFPASYDFIEVEYRIYNGTSWTAWTLAGGIYPESVASGTLGQRLMRIDTGADKIGDGAYLSRTFQQINWDIIGTGTTMELRFRVSADAGTTQEFAIDNFQLLETIATAPTVTTAAATGAGAVKATLGGDVTADGGATVNDRGIVWATTANPTIANTKVPMGTGTGTFSATVSALTAGTTIHFRAYATNSAGTSYGSDLTFNTGAALSATTSQTNVVCYGGNNGTASVTASGGKTSYSYSWFPSGGTGATASALVSGNYTCTITDSELTQITKNFTITQPPAVSGTTTVTNVTCNTSTNGVIDLTPTGGTPGYTYNWGGGITSQDRISLAAGTYSVTIKDANNCTGTVSLITVTQPTAVSGVRTVTNVACNGGTTGVIDLTPSGGTPGYTYSWGGGITTQDRSALAAGTYSVTITDANACTGTVSGITVTQPAAAVSGTTTVTNTTCNSGTNGVIDLTPTGGTPGYTYNWGGGITSQDRISLAAGTYSVTITDANSCTGTVSGITVTQPTAISGTTVVTNVACNSGTTGAINLTPSGGTPGYTFNWVGGNTTEDRTALAAGTYSVTITDANACTGTVSGITVTQPTAISGTTVVTNVACNSGTNGTINLTPTGGTGPYTFNWGGGVTTEDRIALAAGTYSVTITDANSCTGTVSGITVTQPTAISGTTVVTNVACNSGTTGAINLTPSGGTPGYTFNWVGGNTTEDRTALAAGTYSVTITDANACTGTVSGITVTQPAAAVSGTTVVTNVACNSGTNGTINLTPTGGTGPYTFNWVGGNTTEDRTALAAGTYSVTITDANACTGTVSGITVTQPAAAVSGTTVVTNVACNSGTNGTINLTPTGGTGPYTFNWGGGITSEDRTGLAAGTYSVTITDANSCTATVAGITVTQPTAISGTTVVTNVACNSGTTGAINLTPTGGTGPYTFNWGGGNTTEDRIALAAGTYSVTITDANSCTGTVSGITITQSSVIAPIITAQTNVACNGGANGAATVTATGGAGAYSYSWAPTGGTGATVSGLTAGTYTVTVTDANSCSKTASATITQPSVIAPIITAQTNVSCNGGTNGAATVTATGGAGAYTYSWTPSGGTAATATGLAAGTYNVTVTDANSCFKSATVIITEPTPLDLTVTKTGNTLTANQSGATYQWYKCSDSSPIGTNSNSITPAQTGDYKVAITKGSCTLTSSCVTVNGTLNTADFTTAKKAIIYPNPAKDFININTEYEGNLEIVDNSGRIVKTFKVVPNVTNSVNVENLTEGIYYIKTKEESKFSTLKLIIKK